MFQDLWRKAIKQQILLLRMEKENQRIVGRYLFFISSCFRILPFCDKNHSSEHEEQLAERRLKLDYSSLVSSSESTLQTWEGGQNSLPTNG